MSVAVNPAGSQAQSTTHLNGFIPSPSRERDILQQQAHGRIERFPGLRPTEREVLRRLADHVQWPAPDGWVASVSQIRLAGETHVSRSTIARAITALAGRGYLRKLPPRKDGDTCRYLLLAKMDPPSNALPKKTRTGRCKMTHYPEEVSSPVPNPLPNIPLDPIPISSTEIKKPANGSGERAREAVSKLPFGELGNVRITAEEHGQLQAKLTAPIADAYIQTLDFQIAATARVYKSHYATVMLWFTQDQRKTSTTTGGTHVQRSKFESSSERKARENDEVVERIRARWAAQTGGGDAS